MIAWLPISLLPQSSWGLIGGLVLLDFGLRAVHVPDLSGPGH